MNRSIIPNNPATAVIYPPYREVNNQAAKNGRYLERLMFGLFDECMTHDLIGEIA